MLAVQLKGDVMAATTGKKIPQDEILPESGWGEPNWQSAMAGTWTGVPHSWTSDHYARIYKERSLDQHLHTSCFYENTRRSNFLWIQDFAGVFVTTSLVMRESQFNELRGLPNTAVSGVISGATLLLKYTWAKFSN
jgi:hypothetical protein